MLEQVAEAMRRYLPNHRLLEEGTAATDDGPAADDGPWCLIELVGRNVVAGGGFELPDPNGAYQADESDEVDGFPIIWLDTPGDWRFFEADADPWEEVRRRLTVEPRVLTSSSYPTPEDAASWPELLLGVGARAGDAALWAWAVERDSALCALVEGAAGVLRGRTRAPGASPGIHDGDLSGWGAVFARRFGPGHTWSASRLESLGIAHGMRLLKEDGVRLIREGLTTPEEVLRVANV